MEQPYGTPTEEIEIVKLFCGAVFLLLTIGLAAMEGGPKPMRAERATNVVGAILPICNSAPTINPLLTKYPISKNYGSCGFDYENGTGPVAPGGVIAHRFEYDLKKPVCRKHPDCHQLYEYNPMSNTDKCMKVAVSVN
jgi:hypothetical protein